MKPACPRHLALLAALCAFLAGPLLLIPRAVHAQALVDATNPQTILNIASGYGSAEPGTNANGDPMITGRIDGTRYTVIFGGCINHRNCKSLLFFTIWVSNAVTLSAINQWNKNAVFGKGYLDNDNNPVLEMTVNLDHGVSRANLDDTIDWWRIAINRFTREFNL